MYYLDVGSGHRLFVQHFNKNRTIPYLFIHGGPGSAPNSIIKESFIKRGIYVIFISQRGCPESQYLDPLCDNTTNSLISDMATLLEHEGIHSVNLFATSWGCSLAVKFASCYPQLVKNMVLRAPFLSTSTEIEYLYLEQKLSYPGLWEKCFGNTVCNDRLEFFNSIYLNFIKCKSFNEQEQATKHWIEWELNLANNDTNLIKENVTQKDIIYCMVQLHYFRNDMFFGGKGVVGLLREISSNVIVISSNSDRVAPIHLGAHYLTSQCKHVTSVKLENYPHSALFDEVDSWINIIIDAQTS